MISPHSPRLIWSNGAFDEEKKANSVLPGRCEGSDLDLDPVVDPGCIVVANGPEVVTPEVIR